MKRNYMLKTAITFMMLIGVVIYVNAFVSFNDIPPAFETSAVKGMESLTIEGTSYFLRSNADVFLLLNQVEVGYPDNLDFVECLSLTDSATRKLKMARDKYSKIMSEGLSSRYSFAMVSRLKQFNYDRHAKIQGLNRELMRKVKLYLGNGDVIGLYTKNIENIDTILTLLNEIKAELDSETVPRIDQFWLLLQQFSDAIFRCNLVTAVY